MTEDLAVVTTPNYNEDADAERYPVAIPNPVAAHHVFKGNPQIDGPYLDDVREAQEAARREAKDRVHDIQRQKAEEDQKLRDSLTGKVSEEVTPEEVNSDDSWLDGE